MEQPALVENNDCVRKFVSDPVVPFICSPLVLYIHCCEPPSYVVLQSFEKSSRPRVKTVLTTEKTCKFCRRVRNCETARRREGSAGRGRRSRSGGKRSRTCRRSRRRRVRRRRHDSCRGRRRRAASRAEKMKQKTCRALRKYRRRAREKFKDTVKEINTEAKVTNRIRQIYRIPKK